MAFKKTATAAAAAGQEIDRKNISPCPRIHYSLYQIVYNNPSVVSHREELIQCIALHTP
jgi:hypothetical protein